MPFEITLTVGVGSRPHNLQHCGDIHSVGGIEDERAALRRVAAHVHQPAQRFRTQAGDEDRGSLAERLDFGRAARSAARRQSAEVADDDLVVGGGPVLLFDGARDVGRVGRHRRAFGLARGNRGAGQADPQLGGAGAPAAAAGAGSLAAIADQRQPIERERMQPEMRPVLRQRGAQAEGALAIGISREQAQGAADFADVDAVDEADGTEMMAMQAFGEPPQQRVIRDRSCCLR